MKTIKIKSGIFLTLLPAFNELYQMKMGAGLRYKLDLISGELNKNAKPFFLNRNEIVKEHANLDAKGQIKTINVDGVDKYDISEQGVTLINELMNAEAEFQIPSLRIEDLDRFEFLPNEWAMIKILVDLPEEN